MGWEGDRLLFFISMVTVPEAAYLDSVSHST